MLAPASRTDEDTHAGNRSSYRPTKMFKRLSHITTSYVGRPSFRQSVLPSPGTPSFRKSVLPSPSTPGFQDNDLEHHTFAEKRRKRDSKVIPKSWKFLGITPSDRGGHFRDMYEKARNKQASFRRSAGAQAAFKWTFYVLLAATVYLLFIGMPLWRGAVWYMYILFNKHLVLKAGMAITFGLSFL